MNVSVIIPCYNVTAYIEECVRSVYNQTYRPIQVVCVDNNSTDNTVHVIRQLAKEFPDLIVISEKTPGAPAARNRGLAVATGEWVQFLDADDLLLPDKIQRQIAFAEINTPCDLIASPYILRSWQGDETPIGGMSSDPYLGPFINRAGITSANLWRREAVLKVGGWNPALQSSQETELMFRLVLNGATYVLCPYLGTVIRQRPQGQISQRNPAEKWLQYISSRTHYLGQLQERHPEIYKSHERIFLDFLAVATITLARFDARAAKEIYALWLKDRWNGGGGFGLSKFRAALLKIIGLPLYSRLSRMV